MEAKRFSKNLKKEYLSCEIEHIDIKSFNAVPIIEAMGRTAFQAKNLYRASLIYDKMLQDKDCTIIMCLAGSLISAGLKKAISDLIKNNMIDVIVSTGANLVDQDFFEGLGFKHYQGTPFVDDNELRDLHIDRIYDTFIDEDELRICDETVTKIANKLEPRAYSSREFLYEMGEYLEKKGKCIEDSIIYNAYKKNLPLFCPAFSDSSAGFGLVLHQVQRKNNYLTIDSVADFRELTMIKIKSEETGLLMIGGGVPKNFAQDIVVAAEVLGHNIPMHKYAIQITVADERDGGLSGSTLKEASSWGKVEQSYEQMVFCEATIAFPLLASYAYHKKNWKNRKAKRFKF